MSFIGIKLAIGQAVSSGAASFSIAHSFLFNGTSEYFTIPNADIPQSTFTGTSQYTIYMMVYINAFGGNRYLFAEAANKFYVHTDVNGRIILQAGAGTFIAPNGSATVGVWNFIKVSIDLDTPSNSKIKVDNIDTIATGTPAPTTGLTGIWNLGRRGNNSSFASINLNSFAIIKRLVTDVDDDTFYNSGNPLSANAFFGNDCITDLTADNSGDTAQFIMADSVNSVNATSFNMSDSDKTTLTPYT